MDKEERQKNLLKLLKTQKISNQSDLVALLEKKGIPCTQASVSRDLAELRIVKVDGVYKPQEIKTRVAGGLVGAISIDRAGDHLVVIKGGPGSAQAAALVIDRSKLTGIVGTVAGDDTIFIAVKSSEDQRAVIRQLHKIFLDLE